MSTLNYTSAAAYYRHSGRVPLLGLLLTLLAGMAAAILLGAVYAYADLYNPIAGYVTFVITGGAGYLLGWVLAKTLVGGKVRNVPAAALLALLIASFMYLITWDVWLFALIQRVGGLDLGFLDIALHPAVAWDLILRINDQGAWTISGATPTGILLDAVWAAEAAMLIGIPIWVARKAVAKLPFCETCNKWCTQQQIIRLNLGKATDVRPRLEARDFSVLGALGQASSVANSYWNVYFQGCASCDATQTLCIDELKITTDSKGKTQINRKPVISRLILSPEDTVALATTAGALKAPPPPSPQSALAQPPAGGTA